ncbi:hypothetical protein GWO43_30200 [candidate division KSB1 bacterium]|nr:hypothetical protein [candidate division KSB1 bacterium]NIV70630.1 hypothetical protein [Phycisphaerae bacterium]NIS28163.1 hypothetical protein [candidate division KSB1 bacterium]NIT75055.1 hypothetical protein [candidate division KSB1 bacterium]NIU28841.1 hypothetical protein [candidate division KSB1 bacterium]
MNIFMVSIPHTGTNLLLNILKATGLPDWTLAEPQEGIHHGHVMDAYLAERFDCPIVSPLRHPHVTEISWRKRDKDTTEMCEGFRVLANLDPIVVPVDSPQRDKHLKDAGKKLKLELTSEWPVTNSIGNWALIWRDITPSQQVKELTDEIQPFIQRYY